MIAKVPANVELDDLVQAGMIGLWDSLKRFDEGHGVQFETFATQRIRGAILDELRGNDWMTRNGRRDQRRIEAAVHRLEQRFGRAPREAEIAREMGLSVRDYQGLLATVRGSDLVCLEDMAGDDGDEDFLDRHLVGDLDPSAKVLEEKRRAEAMAAVIERMPERERWVLTMHCNHGVTLSDLATVLGVTESRVSQLLKMSVQRLQKRLTHDYGYQG